MNVTLITLDELINGNKSKSFQVSARC